MLPCWDLMIFSGSCPLSYTVDWNDSDSNSFTSAMINAISGRITKSAQSSFSVWFFLFIFLNNKDPAESIIIPPIFHLGLPKTQNRRSLNEWLLLKGTSSSKYYTLSSLTFVEYSSTFLVEFEWYPRQPSFSVTYGYVLLMKLPI